MTVEQENAVLAVMLRSKGRPVPLSDLPEEAVGELVRGGLLRIRPDGDRMVEFTRAALHYAELLDVAKDM